MFANRLLLLSAALSGALLGCGGDDNAHAARKPAASAAPAAAPKHAPTSTSTKKAPPSGQVRYTGGKVGSTSTSKSSSTALKVPEAHYPPAGQCRIWRDGLSIFKQAQARSCDGIVSSAPAGSMIIERPSKDTKVIRVRYVDASRAGHVVKTRVFDATTGRYLRDG